MTIKDILLHLGPDAPAGFALSLAERMGAHVTAATVVIDIPAPVPDPAGLAAGWNFTDYEPFEKIAALRRSAAEQDYARFAAAAPAGVATESVMIEAYLERAGDEFARLARHFDLTIIARDDGAAGGQSGPLLSSALFGSGRPLFIAPPGHEGPAGLDRALVCWNASAQAARALSSALPLLRAAGSVEVLCVSDADAPSRDLPGFNIARHLARHGVAATLRDITTAQDAASAILGHAADSAADFLVMGGYGHWRLSEMILGGTTRAILGAAPIPVFIAH
ncbi:universal stress protein [Rhodoblastus sp.]|uniref:universal stress protein n=1 Tax=Rhodoblastus sp. TaxID=1962975 RepID=UPI0035B27D89